MKTAFGVVGDGIADDTAAIQAALDSLTNASKNIVLWFPNGKYLTTGLHVTKAQCFSVIAEDPHTTVLKYIGKPGGTMLEIDDALYFQIKRLSFDGSGTAGSAIVVDTPAGSYSTFNGFSDQHIYGAHNGIALANAAETTIERVFFDNLPGFGVQTGNPNVLNIFVNDCLFVKNGIGVTNTPFAGSFVVSNSFFSHSVQADMQIGNTGYYTSRHNTSVGSAAAFIAGMIGANPAQITIQNNTVLDPTGIPYVLGDQGPLMLIDNVVRTQDPTQPVIWAYDDNTVSRSIFTVGNTFTTEVVPFSGRNLPFQGVVTSYDDSVTDPSNIPDVTIPEYVYVPPNLNRPVFDVSVNSPGTEIQKQINLAVSMGGAFPIVHMPPGYYSIQTPIVVPAGSHIHLVGDDVFSTVLLWNGTGPGPVIEGDSATVTMEGFRIKRGTGTVVDGVRMSLADQPSTQIVIDQAQLQTGNSVSVDFDGLEHATAEMFSTYVLGSKTGVSVTAGPFRAAKVGALGMTNFYSGSAQNQGNSTSFDVSRGGRLLVQDNWHDWNGSGPHNFILSGSGVLTEQVGAVYTTSDTPFEINNFDGKVSLIGLVFQGHLSVKPGQSKTQLLTLGLDGNSSDYPLQPSSNLVTANILNLYYSSRGGVQIANGSLPEPKWLRSMLAQTRSEYPVPRLPMVGTGTRARFSRFQVDGLASALHFMPTGLINKLTYTLALGTNLLSTSNKGTGACSAVPQNNPGNSTMWTLAEAGDGDYVIMDSTGTNALAVTSATSAISLAPLDNQYDQRWIIQDVGDGRKLLRSRGAPGVLWWTVGACPRLVTDTSSELTKWSFFAN